MKKLLIILIFMPVFLLAQSYGIGVILGSPTGLTGKMMLGRTSAIAVNAGWSFWPSSGFHITGDYQFLFPGSFADEDGRPINSLIPYLGLGGRVRFKSDDDDDDDFQAGVRFGGGIEYLPTPMGIFIELYPVVNLIPSTKFAFEGGLGFRIYF
ncbi:MAG: hypothetical protein JSW02_02525 [candidate division WOR-3 bacterium]|nr:MAG: hypothetical protein JSW02_02525 [candidate division WOR-3 bacterium]